MTLFILQLAVFLVMGGILWGLCLRLERATQTLADARAGITHLLFMGPNLHDRVASLEARVAALNAQRGRVEEAPHA